MSDIVSKRGEDSVSRGVGEAVGIQASPSGGSVTGVRVVDAAGQRLSTKVR